MKVHSSIIVVVGVLLVDSNPVGGFLPSPFNVARLNQRINSIISAPDKLKELKYSLAKSIRSSKIDSRLKKLRLYYFNKYSIKASLRSTITLSSTSTSIITTALYCARFQNNGVTGSCRRRKQLPINADLVSDEIEQMSSSVVQPTAVLNRQDMTKLVHLPDDNWDPAAPYSWPSDNVIQPSLSTVMEADHPPDHPFKIDGESGRFFKLYKSLFSPVYVYYLTISTSYVYTDTTTFFITSCIPQPFSYSICRTLPG